MTPVSVSVIWRRPPGSTTVFSPSSSEGCESRAWPFWSPYRPLSVVSFVSGSTRAPAPACETSYRARIIEALLACLDARWTRHLEVPVYRPVRGVIDAVLVDLVARVVGATEVQSELRRLEQQLRWAHEKADALPSASIWRFKEPAPPVDRLLVLRNTRTNRRVVEAFATTFATEYPNSSNAMFLALTTPEAIWPGSAILWANVQDDVATILDQPPRGITVGR
jgi:hypothetical protein